MGILEQIRSKLKIAADVPNSKALTQALDVEQTKLDKKDRDIQAVKDGLALAALGADGGKASTDQLERLGRERLATQSIADALRIEIAAALKAERWPEQDSHWDESQRHGDAFDAAATRADAVISAAAATIATAIWELNAAESAFEQSIPDRGYHPWGYGSQRPTARDGFAIAVDTIRAHIRDDGSTEKVWTLKALAQEQLDCRLRARPIAAEESNATPDADEQHDLSQATEQPGQQGE